MSSYMKYKKSPQYFRKVILEKCSRESDLNAFIIDYFNNTYMTFSDDQDMTEKINVLLTREKYEDIYKAIIDKWTDVESRFQYNVNSEPTPTVLNKNNDIVSCLFHRYSLVLGDGNGPEEYLSPYFGLSGEHARPNKAAFMHWEGKQYPDHGGQRHPENTLRDKFVPLKRSTYPQHLIDQLEPREIDIESIVEQLVRNNSLLDLSIRLLPPGVHISFSVLPLLEYRLREVRPSAVIYTIMPRIESGDDVKQPNGLSRVYWSDMISESGAMANGDIFQLLKSVDSENIIDYIVIRPCGGFSLQKIPGNSGQVNLCLEQQSVTVTDDHYHNIAKYGLLGNACDEEMFRILFGDNRRILYAEFEMDYSATRSMADWVMRYQNPRLNDMVLNRSGLYRHEGIFREPKCRSEEFPNDSEDTIRQTYVDDIYDRVNSGRTDNARYRRWWERNS